MSITETRMPAPSGLSCRDWWRTSLSPRPAQAILVVNPFAGAARRGACLAGIERRLRAAGLEVRHVAASGPAAAAEALGGILRHESPHDTRVIVAGGDGTVNAILPVLMGTGFPLAILPLGTLNVLARELEIPRSVEEAMQVAASGCIRRIDLGLANGRPFSLLAGIGLDAAIVHRAVPARNKSRFGLSAYAGRIMRLFARYSPSRFRIATDRVSTECKAWLAVVANASRYAFEWRLAPGARMDDGRLDLWLFQSGSSIQTASQAISIIRGTHPDCPGVTHIQARRLQIDCDPPLYLQLDGGAAGSTPADITVAREALAVVVPDCTPR